VEARKKAETESMLIDARKNQMHQKEHYLAVQAQRERNEFERVLRLGSYIALIFVFILSHMAYLLTLLIVMYMNSDLESTKFYPITL